MKRIRVGRPKRHTFRCYLFTYRRVWSATMFGRPRYRAAWVLGWDISAARAEARKGQHPAEHVQVRRATERWATYRAGMTTPSPGGVGLL